MGWKFFAVVFGVSVLGCLHLQAAEGMALTLAQAQQLALQRNADLRIAESQVAAALAQVRTARTFPNPSLSLSTAKIATDGQGNATAAGNRFLDRSYDSIIALSQLFEIGKRGPRQDSARAGQRMAEAQRDDARRLLVQSVSLAYVAALEARQEDHVFAQSAESLRREANLAATRLAAGDIGETEKAQIEIAATRLELDASAARHTATIAVITLETLLGIPSPSGQTQLTDTLGSLPVPPIPTSEKSTTPRPDVVAAEANLAKAESDLLMQHRATTPDLTVSVQFERNPPDQPNTAGLGVSLPLPLWNRNTGGIRAARAAREQAQAQLDKAHLQVAADTTTARMAYDEAFARSETYAKQVLPQSEHVVKTVTYSYEHGGAALIELLAAERADNDIRLASARARADFASAAFSLAAALNHPLP